MPEAESIADCGFRLERRLCLAPIHLCRRLTLKVFASWYKRPYNMRIFVITGAGISAESGIPTFRGMDGYWRNFDPAKLATPEAFARDPKLVWEWYRERRQRIREAKPNAAHAAITRLSMLTAEFMLLTQNVDDLHSRAGLLKEKIVQIHGDIFVTRCSCCGFSRTEPEHPPSLRYGAASGQESKEVDLPKCPECNALLRPAVVWFGEQLDPGKIDMVENYLADRPCDLVVVIGTTALFGYIVDWALRARGHSGELIEINPEETPLSRFATKCVREPAAVALPRLVSEIVGQPHRLPETL
jgi:NAD-dependent deacetylase